MKLSIVFCLLLTSFLSRSQPLKADFVFDKKVYECENTWVVFPKSISDSLYFFGFVYIDELAGFTFNLEGSFSVDKAGAFVLSPKSKGVTKYRLGANTKPVAVFSAEQQASLKLPAEPDWLKSYASNAEKSVASLVNRGRHYNHVGGYDIAFRDLIEAYNQEPSAAGLEFELAFNYNATGKYEKAVDLLKGALTRNPQDGMLYRELVFAYIHTNRLQEAEDIYLKSINSLKNVSLKTETAYNIAYGFFLKNDKEKFKEWFEKTRRVAPEQSPLVKRLIELERDLGNVKQK